MVKRVGVVGAGMMGAEIAVNYMLKDIDVIMSDISLEACEKGKAAQVKALDRKVRKGQIDEAQKEAALSHITLTDDIKNMADCDLIIEAVSEREELKKSIFAQLDGICKPETILASNTSSISITKLSSAVSDERKAKFIGLHYNSPASVMKLVEVIPALLTSEETIAACMETMEYTNKVAVRVKDVVGFALNRILHAYNIEAHRLVEEGVCSIEDVDKICKYGLGHPLGIFELIDNTSLDLNLQVQEILFDAYGERYRPSQMLERYVASGRLGKKVGKGYYDYPDKK